MKKLTTLFLACFSIFCSINYCLAQSWDLAGNSGTNASTQFLGTVDNKDFKIRTKNSVRITVKNTGLVGIGTTAPTGKLHIKGNTNISQLVIDANATQDNSQPLIRLRNSTGTDLMFIHSDDVTNTFLGLNTGMSNNVASNGIENTFLGSGAGKSNTTAHRNTVVGCNALYSGTTGHNNVVIGAGAMTVSYSAFGNTTVGTQSMFQTTEGFNNAAFGIYAMYSNTLGYENTALGESSLGNNTTGYENVAVGSNCLGGITVGHNNIAIGSFCGTSGDFNNTISIGNKGYLNSYGNQAFLGNLSTLWTGGQTTWFTYASDGRVKKNVNEDVIGLEFISKLRPVTYNLDITAMQEITGNEKTSDYPGKYDIEKIKQSGFIAQEVEQAAKETGYNFSGITIPRNEKELYTMSYSQFVVPLVKAVQELDERKEQLKNENANQQLAIVNLQNENQILKNEMNEMKSRIETLYNNLEQTKANSQKPTANSFLNQNNPNPFKENTTIGFYISSESSKGLLQLFSMNGEEIKSFVISTKGKGQIEIAGNTLAPGVYTYVLIVDDKTVDTKQMVVTK